MTSNAIISNRNSLATTQSRDQALELVEAGISRVLPAHVMASSVAFDRRERHLSINGNTLDLSEGRLFVVGGGKASASMAESLEQIVGSDAITAGIVATKYGSKVETRKVSVVLAGHPVPDANGVEAVRRMLGLKNEYFISESDTVLCLISGGGSALMPCPADRIPLDEKRQITALLLESGASISEINCVRKHLSAIKGGQLGRLFAPATVISLILSDVIGNDLSVIASGPTYPDPTTFSDALSVLSRYELMTRASESIVSFLRRGESGEVEETPKELPNCHNFVIADNKLALEAMEKRACELGLSPQIVTAEQAGDTGGASSLRATEIIAGKYARVDAVILGGETTPRLPPDHGKGGRNQHFAAVSLLAMKDYGRPWTLTSVGTDGSDYVPDAAGAIVDDLTFEQLHERKLDVSEYVKRYDSYGLFSQTSNCLVKTGNTGTNVGDIVVYILR